MLRAVRYRRASMVAIFFDVAHTCMSLFVAGLLWRQLLRPATWCHACRDTSPGFPVFGSTRHPCDFPYDLPAAHDVVILSAEAAVLGSFQVCGAFPVVASSCPRYHGGSLALLVFYHAVCALGSIPYRCQRHGSTFIHQRALQYAPHRQHLYRL